MGERPVSFDQTDLDDMLAKMGFTDDILYIDRISKKVLAEMGHMFIEQLLDSGNYKRREVTIEDIDMNLTDKFPSIADRRVERNIEVLDRRSAQINRINEIV